jgi:hypothetical protein
MQTLPLPETRARSPPMLRDRAADGDALAVAEAFRVAAEDDGERLEALLRGGRVSPAVADADGNTLLHEAAARGALRAAKAVVKLAVFWHQPARRAYLDTKNGAGFTPLDLARAGGFSRLAAWLLALGVADGTPAARGGSPRRGGSGSPSRRFGLSTAPPGGAVFNEWSASGGASFRNRSPPGSLRRATSPSSAPRLTGSSSTPTAATLSASSSLRRTASPQRASGASPETRLGSAIAAIAAATAAPLQALLEGALEALSFEAAAPAEKNGDDDGDSYDEYGTGADVGGPAAVPRGVAGAARAVRDALRQVEAVAVSEAEARAAAEGAAASLRRERAATARAVAAAASAARAEAEAAHARATNAARDAVAAAHAESDDAAARVAAAADAADAAARDADAARARVDGLEAALAEAQAATAAAVDAALGAANAAAENASAAAAAEIEVRALCPCFLPPFAC